MTQRAPNSAAHTLALLAAAVVAGTMYVLSEGLERSALLLVAGLLPIAAILVGLRIHRITDRLPWLLLVAGLSLLSIVNAVWLVVTGLGDATSADSPLTLSLQAAGYLGILAAAILVVLRHAPDDPGGAIDAALIGLGIAAPIWEFVLRPRLLDSGTPLPTQSVLLIQVLVLLAVLGALLRIARSAEPGHVALRCMFAALAATVVGLVLSVATTDPETGRRLPYVGVFWIWGYLFLTVGGLHRSAADLLVPVRAPETPPESTRLSHLGLVLLLNPIIGGVPQLLGEPPDGLLLCFGQLLTIPLVVTRIGLMMAQRARDQRLLVEQATRDHLTGLANRRHVFALLDAAVCRHREETGPPVTLLFCDLNDFKTVNDRWGHEAGDHVLRALARRLAACVRSGDIVGRIGGDEFVVVCQGTGAQETAAMRDRILRSLGAPVQWDGRTVTVGAAVGIATSGSTTPSGDALVAAADTQMYAHKRAHKHWSDVEHPGRGAAV